jgi:hypothetical protein
VFTPASGDIVVAEASSGPVVVARDGAQKQILIGFHPGRSSMKYELATPLLTANILRWVSPGTYRRFELEAGTAGTVNLAVEPNTDPAGIRIRDESGSALPFTLKDGTLTFFAGTPGAVHVEMGDRELVYSLTLPDVAAAAWEPPANVLKGVPRAALADAAPTDVWPWLALLGGLGLLADWILFGRSRIFRLRPDKAASGLAAHGNIGVRKAS